MGGVQTELLSICAAGINQFLDSASPQDEYFLEYISETPSIKTAFTSDVSLIRKGLRPKPKGRTALSDSVDLALATMQKARNANRALLIISDGLDDRSSKHLQELEKAFLVSPVPIFLVVPKEPFGKQERVLPEAFESRSNFLGFIQRSGGLTYGATGKQQMSQAMAILALLIRSPYLIQLAPHADKPSVQGAPPDLKVEVPCQRRLFLLFRVIQTLRENRSQ